MAYISTCSEMPDVQTAEEILDWLTEDIRSGEEEVSFVILDREELEKLTVLSERFRQNRTRNNEHPETQDNSEEVNT